MESPSRSPRFATDAPNWSSLASVPEKPPSVELIFWCPFTLPSALRKRIQTAPRSAKRPAPPSSSPGAPTATSGIPSPSRSPRGAKLAPKRSLLLSSPVKPPTRAAAGPVIAKASAPAARRASRRGHRKKENRSLIGVFLCLRGPSNAREPGLSSSKSPVASYSPRRAGCWAIPA
jgi:hypothetical protein